MGCGSMGSSAKLALLNGGSPYSWSGGTRFAPVVDGLGVDQQVVIPAGLTGSRGLINTYQRRGLKAISGELIFEPTPRLFGLILPWMTGDASSPHGLANTLADGTADFGVLADRVGGTFEYQDCKIAGWSLSGSVGELLTLTLAVVGRDSATNVTFPAGLALPATADLDEPFIFHECAFNLNSGVRYLDDFTLSVDQGGGAIFRNSPTMRCFQEGQLSVAFGTNSAFTATEMSELYNQSDAGYPVSITITNGSYIETIALTRFQPDLDDPNVSGPDEIVLPLAGQVAGDSSEPSPLVWTHAT